MGLDMYLEARLSAYKPYGQAVEPHRAELEKAALAVGLPASDNLDYITITRECGYWRKANAIHRWFVDTCQGGEDDCRHAYVGRDQLKTLRDICATLLVKRDSDEAIDKLPPQAGFFFGPTDITEWYWSNLESTVEQIDKALTLPEGVEFYYHSSW